MNSGAKKADEALADLARNEAALENAAQEVRDAGGEALVLPLDLASSDAVEAAAAQVEQRWARIDTWVNNAMVSVFSPALQMTMEEFRRVTDVNYLGCVYGTMAALKRMYPRNEGTIVQVSSALAQATTVQSVGALKDNGTVVPLQIAGALTSLDQSQNGLHHVGLIDHAWREPGAAAEADDRVEEFRGPRTMEKDERFVDQLLHGHHGAGRSPMPFREDGDQ